MLSERRDKWAAKEGMLGYLPGAVKSALGSTDAAGALFVYNFLILYSFLRIFDLR